MHALACEETCALFNPKNVCFYLETSSLHWRSDLRNAWGFSPCEISSSAQLQVHALACKETLAHVNSSSAQRNQFFFCECFPLCAKDYFQMSRLQQRVKVFTCESSPSHTKECTRKKELIASNNGHSEISKKASSLHARSACAVMKL